MKKLGYFFIGFLLLASASCSSGSRSESDAAKDTSTATYPPMSHAEIATTVAVTNAQCPINLGYANNVVMQGIQLTDSTVVYIYTVDTIANDLSPMKSVMLEVIASEANSSPANRRFMEGVVNAGLGLEYEYTSDNGDSVSLPISNDELRKALK